MSGLPHYLITCEHGGNAIPPAYRALFSGHEALLRSHRGYDPGALTLAQQLARALDAPLFAARVSRLLVDLNRSPGHPSLFSEIVRLTRDEVREEILEHHYLPYRTRVAEHIVDHTTRGDQVVHVSSHSFTPRLSDEAELRNADVAFLYDPSREGERALCLRWMRALERIAPELRLRRNYPYRGASDGFCTWLRKRHPEPHYLGIELEVNQQYALAGGMRWLRLRRAITAALLTALDRPLPPRARRALRTASPAAPSSPA